jgi:uncharacterized protein YyaL (SSP411 family)
MPNRLANETSPYLLQHANNPVDWYPWGREALDRARAEEKPILLSMGYAACHWCHVMEHESFEIAAIAALMNTHFVNIKVDREERPDLDSVYMQACQAMTGSGGWPMTMFLTPEGDPFYAGTYFPPSDRHGIPGFPRVLTALADAWSKDRDNVRRTGGKVREIYAPAQQPLTGGALSPATLERAYRSMAQQFDEQHAGFGGAPKFPPSMGLDFLLRYWARTGSPVALDMVHRTFLAMSRGGIFDQVGGGLHRYSVDDHWLVPHFEKMLYDNALFLRLGLHLWQATGDAEVREACELTLTWLSREMTSPDGGWYSSLDADSEGHEGRFYVWSVGELQEVLGVDAARVTEAWGATPGGNFEGANILNQIAPLAAIDRRHGDEAGTTGTLLARAREALYTRRAARVWPGLDDKILASWNGLMLRAVVEAARVLGSDQALHLARRNAAFLLQHLVRDGRVLRSYREGKVQDVGFLEDQAAVALAFLDLFSLTADTTWVEAARRITEYTVVAFRDPGTGLFYDTPSDHEALITRPRDITDNAIPSGSSLLAELLTRLGTLDDRQDLRDLGESLVTGLGESLGRYPAAFGHLLGVADELAHGPVEVVVLDEPAGALEEVLRRTYVPSLVTSRDEGATALSRGKHRLGGAPTAWVCRRYLCEAPATTPELLTAQLIAARGSSRT